MHKFAALLATNLHGFICAVTSLILELIWAEIFAEIIKVCEGKTVSLPVLRLMALHVT